MATFPEVLRIIQEAERLTSGTVKGWTVEELCQVLNIDPKSPEGKRADRIIASLVDTIEEIRPSTPDKADGSFIPIPGPLRLSYDEQRDEVVLKPSGR